MGLYTWDTTTGGTFPIKDNTPLFINDLCQQPISASPLGKYSIYHDQYTDEYNRYIKNDLNSLNNIKENIKNDIKENIKMDKKIQDSYTPTKVIVNLPAVIVFFSDKTKVVVKQMDTDKHDIYSAVSQAIVKKMFGSTSKYHKIVSNALEDHENG